MDRWTIVYLILFCSFFIQKRGTSQYRFVNYDYSHGLPISGITKIAEDSVGYLWLGSNNGLVKFDGLEFKHFLAEGNDITTPYGSEIADIQVDHIGKVWITFHEGGLSVYDHKTQKFKSRFYLEEDKNDFPRNAILSCAIDPIENNLWMITSSEGLFVMNMETWESKNVIRSTIYTDVIFDENDPEYVFVSGRKNLIKVNKKTREWEELSKKPLRGLIKAGSSYYGHDWSSNVYHLDESDKSETSYPTAFDHINRTLILHNKELWLGMTGGLEIFDIRSGNSQLLQRDPENPHSIANHNITALYKDKAERIWVGTKIGLSVIVPEFQKLTNFQPEVDDRYTDIVAGESADKYYTIAHYDNEIKEIDLATGESSLVKFDTIRDFQYPLKALRHKDRIWVLFYKGFGSFSDDDQTITKFDGGRYDDLFHKESHGDLVIDQDDNIWLSRNHNNYVCKIPTSDPNSIDTIQLQKGGVKIDIKTLHWNDSILWIGTNVGLCRYDPRSSEGVKWIYPKSSEHSFLNEPIEHLSSDNDNNLWVLSLKKGAWKCKYDRENEAFEIIKEYGQKDGMPNNRPWIMDTGNDGSIYFGSNSGFSIYYPQNDRMVYLNEQYGFLDQSINVKTLGDRVFIYSRGLSYFDLEDLNFDNSFPKAKIESISITNQKKIIDGADEIRVDHDQNDIAIDYLAIDLSFGRELKYRYRINEEDSWQIVDYTQRKAIYNQLAPGKYTFEVAASGKNMIWGPSSTISLTIRPPFWRSWWFIPMCILVFGAMFVWFYRLRINQIRTVSNMRSKMAELENAALRAQMNPHFIFNSLNSIKSFIIHNRREEAADYLTAFSDLIRMVLNNSKKRFISLSEEKEALDLYMEIENIRLENKFSFQWQMDLSIQADSIIIPPLTIQPFVENAIWHGFVHKEERGSLNIKITKESNNLVIVVNDDGVGRVKSREIEKNHPRKRSFGIEITEQRLNFDKKLSQVEIKDLYDDQNNALGTEVTIKIPLQFANHEKF